MERLLEMRGIVKTYGAVRANDGVDLDVHAGQIVGLLGENGSGKSTLMRVLFGMTAPDEGGIVFKGRELSGHAPREAMAAGIGMINQHFMLVDAMTVAENVMLGWDEAGGWLRREQVAELVREASRRYGLDLEPTDIVGDLPLGRRQRVEILKAVLRGADLLILDEPTSNLSPPEVAGLIGVMRRLREEGRGIVFISHKLGEVLALCDEVVVLRDGRAVGRAPVAQATRAELARLMVGRDVTQPLRRDEVVAGPVLLAVEGVRLHGARDGLLLDGVELVVRGGEVLALAGIDGNGQIELVETVAGLRRPAAGTVRIAGRDMTRAGVAARVGAGLAYIPADRAGTSLVQTMSIAENVALRDAWRAPFSRFGWLRRGAVGRAARRLIDAFGIRAPGPEAAMRGLSGGNQQRVVVAREMDRAPRILVAHQATWGLDPAATRFVLERVLALRAAGAAVLYVTSELEEALSVGDRIGVLHAGSIAGVMERDAVDLERIGLMMAGETDRPEREVAA